jgi:predicted AlkP superfamily phosphohydrolase/phosphomutase
MLLRTVASAALAASLLAADMTLLTLFLNPQVTIRHDGGALLLALWLPYTGFLTLAYLLLALAGAAVRGWPRAEHPPIEGLPCFTSLVFASVGAATALYWLNLLSYRHSIPVEFLRALLASALALTGALLVLVAVAVDSWLFPLRGRGPAAALVVLAAASSVVVPLALRPALAVMAPPLPVATDLVRPVRRVSLVGIDGIGAQQIRQAVAAGRLPSFASLIKRGAFGTLATLRPTEGPPIWTTILTGRLPRDHGVKSFVTYRLRGSATVYELLPKGALVGLLERAGLVSTSPVTGASRKSRALWDAMNAFGIQTGVVRMWGTYPPERVQGFMLSPYFHLLRHDPARVRETLHPPDLLEEVQARAVEPADVDAMLLSHFVDVSAGPADDRVPWRRDLVERALAPDLTYHRAGAVLREAYDPPFFATYFYGLDVVSHSFMRFAQPDRFGDVRPEEVSRYGHVIERYAAFLGEWLDEAARALKPNEVLLVVSGYGMEPVPHWRRLLSALTGNSGMTGTHTSAPDGFILAVGDGIRAGATFRQASVLDVAPTILYLMSLPVARDMEGRVATEVVSEEFARAHPLTFIPSYESLAVTPARSEPDLDLPPLPEDGP